VCNYDTRQGKIDPAKSLGSPFLVDLTLKGMIHELGHGFQLPHIGPRKKDASGNSLMGPNHESFRRLVRKRDERVYLSEAAAAMLSQHPSFRGVSDDRRKLPNVAVMLQRYLANPSKNTITVSGLVRSNSTPVFAIVADESDARPGEYWTKHYIGKISKDGRYAVTITEPSGDNGTLKTWFVFENGTSTGNGRQRGKAGALVKPYRHIGNTYRFK